MASSERMSMSSGGPLNPSLLPSRLSMATLLEEAAKGNHGIVFVDRSGGTCRSTYRQLWGRAARLADNLKKHGTAAGSFALLQLGDHCEFVTAIWGCFLAGVVPVPLAPAEHLPAASKLKAVWSALSGPPIISSGPLAARLRACCAPRYAVLDARELANEPLNATPACVPDGLPDDDELAVLLATSGSSGPPKLVSLSHREVIRRSVAYASVSGLGREHTSLNWMPLDHVGGLVMFHVRDVYLGAEQVQVATEHVMSSPLHWLDLLQEYAVRVTWAPNFAFRAVIDAMETAPEREWNLASVSHWISGGEMIVRATMQAFCQRLERSGLNPRALRPAWGMSETSSGIVENDSFDPLHTDVLIQPVSVGRPIPGVTIRIVDEANRLLPQGREGKLQVRGAGLTSGYWGDPVRTRDVFTADGWFNTGDLGIIMDGALAVTGRADEMLIANGLNFHPREVEEAVRQLDDGHILHAVACNGRTLADDTDRLVVFFIPRSVAAGQEEDIAGRIRAAVRGRFGLSPAHVLPLAESELPRTDTGKVQRKVLSQRFRAGAFDQLIAQGKRGSGHSIFEKIWIADRSRSRRGGPLPLIALTGARSSTLDGMARALAVAGARVERAESIRAALVTPHDGQRCIVYVALAPDARITAEQASDAWFKTLLPDLHQLREAAASDAEPTTLVLVTCGTQQVVASDRLCWHAIGAAGLWGTARVLQNESPSLRVRLVDIDAGATAQEFASALLDVARGCSTDASDEAIEDEVAYRAGRRHVLRLSSITQSVSATPWSPRGRAVLVTGGFGGLGLVMAEHLARRGAQRIVLVGRNPPAPAVADRIARCSSVTQVPIEVCRADVTNLAQVRAVVRQRFECCRPLGMVVHAAGAYGDCVVSRLTKAGARETLGARVAGALNVHLAARELGYERFVLFSSVVGLLGYPGLASYAAACEMQETLVRLLRSSGFPATIVSWPAWSDAGRAVGETVRHNEHAGLSSIDTHTALGVFDAIIAADRQCGYALSLDMQKWGQFCPSSRGRTLLLGFADTSYGARMSPADSSGKRRGTLDRQLVEACLFRQLAATLGTPSSSLGLDSRFDELGLTSMDGLMFRDAVERELGVAISPGFTWHYETLLELVEHLAPRVTAN